MGEWVKECKNGIMGEGMEEWEWMKEWKNENGWRNGRMRMDEWMRSNQWLTEPPKGLSGLMIWLINILIILVSLSFSGSGAPPNNYETCQWKILH